MPRGTRAQLAPQFLALLGRTLDREDLAGLLAEHGQACLGNIERHVTNLTPLGLDPQFLCQLLELERITDLVTLCLTLGDREQCEGKITAVIGVRGRTGGDGTGEIAGA